MVVVAIEGDNHTQSKPFNNRDAQYLPVGRYSLCNSLYQGLKKGKNVMWLPKIELVNGKKTHFCYLASKHLKGSSKNANILKDDLSKEEKKSEKPVKRLSHQSQEDNFLK